MNAELFVVTVLFVIAITYLVWWWAHQEKLQILIEVSGLSVEQCVNKVSQYLYKIKFDSTGHTLILGMINEAFANVGAPRFRAQQTELIQEGIKDVCWENMFYSIHARITSRSDGLYAAAYYYKIKIFFKAFPSGEQIKTLSLG